MSEYELAVAAEQRAASATLDGQWSRGQMFPQSEAKNRVWRSAYNRLQHARKRVGLPMGDLYPEHLCD